MESIYHPGCTYETRLGGPNCFTSRSLTTESLGRPAVSRSLEVHTQDSPSRDEVESFIRQIYHEYYGAVVRHFMPTLIAVRGANGGPQGAVGYRAAAQEPLFLEAYIREPIEEVLSARLSMRVPRERIAEVGNLAARSASGAVLFAGLGSHLVAAGYEWIVFTGTRHVLRMFENMQLRTLFLVTADKTLLGPAQHDWGSYYDHEPKVMASHVPTGVAVLKRRLR